MRLRIWAVETCLHLYQKVVVIGIGRTLTDGNTGRTFGRVDQQGRGKDIPGRKMRRKVERRRHRDSVRRGPSGRQHERQTPLGMGRGRHSSLRSVCQTRLLMAYGLTHGDVRREYHAGQAGWRGCGEADGGGAWKVAPKGGAAGRAGYLPLVRFKRQTGADTHVSVSDRCCTFPL